MTKDKIDELIADATHFAEILHGDGYLVEADSMKKLTQALQSQETTLNLFREEVKANKSKIKSLQEELSELTAIKKMEKKR